MREWPAEHDRREGTAAAALGPVFRDEVAIINGATVVRLAGELDLATAPQAERALSEGVRRSTRRMTVDVSGLTFMDCSGLAVILDAANRIGDRGRARLEVRGAVGIVRRVFELAGVTTLLAQVSESGE